MNERYARELAQQLLNEQKVEDREVYAVSGGNELIIVTTVRTYHDPRTANTQTLRMSGRCCPTCSGRGHV